MFSSITTSELIVLCLLFLGTILLVVSMLRSVRGFFASKQETAASDEFQPADFVYVEIPGAIGPLERGEKYEDPLQEKLAAQNLGEITGGGSQLGPELPDGSRVVVSCGLDVDVVDLDPVLELLHGELPALGAPVGTQIQYTRHGVKLVDRLTPGGWRRGEPRTEVHPGFGI
jgi:hypothetical protein